MGMNVDTRGKYLTLDWDNISIDEAFKRVGRICVNYTNVRKLVLSRSPIKGFHVRVYLHGDTNIAMMRRELEDDGVRLANDISNRPDYLHDILWSAKTVNGVRFKAKELITVMPSS